MQADGADAKLQQRVHAQRVLAARNHARQKQAAEAHPAHEGGQQDAHRHGRRTDVQLQHLEPDDLVDERGRAAADEEQQQHRQPLRRLDVVVVNLGSTGSLLVSSL